MKDSPIFLSKSLFRLSISVGMIILASALISCNHYSAKMQKTFQIAGENAQELKKVLTHYRQKDPNKLKYKAAQFLIENMAYHYTLQGPSVDRYYKTLDSIIQDTTQDYFELNTALKQIPEPDPDSIYATYDAQVISADFLIHHIDAAFLTRNYPWTDSVSFEDFCEYVLPYRVEFEPFENWMEIYAQNLQRYTDSLNGINANDSMVCAFFNQNLLHPETDYSIAYQTIFDLYPSKLFDMMTTWSIGRCKELTEFSHYVLRSVGLPIRWDATPNWGNRFNGHSWSTIKMNGKLYPFQLKDPQVEIGKHIRRDVNKISKVYRHMYSIQNESLCMRDIKEKIPPFFNDPYMKDVTDEYEKTINPVIELTSTPPNGNNIAYLTVFNNYQWVPVDWGIIKKQSVLLHKIPPHCVFLVMYYNQNQEFTPASYPFYVTNEGQIVTLRPDTHKSRKIQINRKYPNLNTIDIPQKLINGIFQGANNADFSDAVNLYTIDTLNNVSPHTVRIKNNTPFRFFRFLSPPKGFGNMAELTVYDNLGKEIHGIPIGTTNCSRGNDIHKVFDKDPLTYFLSFESENTFLGLQFNQPHCISEIYFLPHNDGNFIQENNIYELFYYDLMWKSLGRKTGTQTGGTLIFDNVPENTLLLLKNHTHGTEERIFTYINGQQQWY